MATRTVLVRLDPNDPQPDQTGFGTPHLDDWLKKPANCVTVLRHLLILVMDWINAGAPRSGHTMRQFTRWGRRGRIPLPRPGVWPLWSSTVRRRRIVVDQRSTRPPGQPSDLIFVMRRVV